VSVADEVTLAALTADPHPWWHRLRAEAPVVHVPALGGWVTTSYRAASAVLRDPVTFTVDDPRFSTGQLFGPSMLSTDGTEHERFRAAFAADFRPGEIRDRFTAFVAGEVDRLFERAGTGQLEIRTAIAGPLAVSVMAELLGLAGEDPQALLGWYAAIVSGVDRISAGLAAGEQAVAAHTALQARVADAIRSQRAVVAGSGLSVEEAVANAGILLFGGLETTEAMIALAVWHLLRDPAQWGRLVADRQLIDNAVEESLRLEPAATRVDRYATAAATVEGVAIPAGELVIVSLAAANRDPAVFEDPDSFDVSRPNAARNLALAAGPHYCLGAHLTRLETRAVLAALADRWPGAELVAADPPSGLVFRKPGRVVVRDRTTDERTDRRPM
jgi:cytochrome P450